MRNFEHISAIFAGTAIVSAIAIVQPQAAMALTGQEVNEIARSVTVLIHTNRGEQGSGVIISKNDNTYYVLTANHVVSRAEDKDGKIEYTIVTADQQAHELNFETVKSFVSEGVDLAVFEFTSDKEYEVATLANSDLVSEGVPVFVSGWPRPGAMSSMTGNQRIRHFTDGRVSTILETPLEGYQMGYTNTTLGGMSGGPVVDAGGRVVAIHGQADVDDVDAQAILQSASGAVGEEEQQALQQLAGLITTTGFNYGIPISTFLQLAPQMGLYMNLNVENSPPPELGAPYVAGAEPDPEDTIDDLNSVLDTVQRITDTVNKINNIRRRLPF